MTLSYRRKKPTPFRKTSYKLSGQGSEATIESLYTSPAIYVTIEPPSQLRSKQQLKTLNLELQKNFVAGDIKPASAESQQDERQDVSLDFDEIYNETAAGVYRYLRRLTGSRALAEDILQETFMRLHAQLASGVTISHPRAWLFQVATNLSKDEKRNEIRSAIREEGYSEQSTVVDFHSQLEKQQTVRRTLDRLTPRMRQVLLLSCEGFTYREISEITGVEAAYIGVLLQRGRAAFRKHYDEEHERTREEQYKSNSL